VQQVARARELDQLGPLPSVLAWVGPCRWHYACDCTEDQTDEGDSVRAAALLERVVLVARCSREGGECSCYCSMAAGMVYAAEGTVSLSHRDDRLGGPCTQTSQNWRGQRD